MVLSPEALMGTSAPSSAILATDNRAMAAHHQLISTTSSRTRSVDPAQPQLIREHPVLERLLPRDSILNISPPSTRLFAGSVHWSSLVPDEATANAWGNNASTSGAYGRSTIPAVNIATGKGLTCVCRVPAEETKGAQTIHGCFWC